MSVRVVARIRPLLRSEREIDVILRPGSNSTTTTSRQSPQSANGDRKSTDRDNVVRIPHPKNESEEYSFQFNSVYDAEITQQEFFDAEGECHKKFSCWRL